jgi:quercetin dioxygenase-like cupin family protein
VTDGVRGRRDSVAKTKKETDMRKKIIWLTALSAAVVFAVLYHARNVGATGAVGFVGNTIATGTFGDIDVFNHFAPPRTEDDERGGREEHKWKNVWLSWQKTKGPSDLFVQQNTWDKHGTTGWHTHPGHSLIIVTEGTVTTYEGDDPECQPTVYTKGMTFVDPGGDHVHIIRNETELEAQTIAVQLIPAGQSRRIEADDPENCHFQ